MSPMWRKEAVPENRVRLCPPCGGRKQFLKMTMTQLLELLTMLILKAFIQSWLWNPHLWSPPWWALLLPFPPSHSLLAHQNLPISCIRTPLPPYILLNWIIVSQGLAALLHCSCLTKQTKIHFKETSHTDRASQPSSHIVLIWINLQKERLQSKSWFHLLTSRPQ